jgi:hypothetical protein
MQSEPIPERDFDRLEREAVYLLTDPERHPPIWALADIGRELDTHDPEAIVAPLVRAGLLNRTSEDYVFATPAAFKWVQLVGHVVTAAGAPRRRAGRGAPRGAAKVARVSPQRLEELLERTHDLRYVHIDLVKVGEADKPGLSVPERYIRGDVALHVHLRIARKRIGAEPCELCVRYQPAAVLQEGFVVRDLDPTICMQEMPYVLSASPGPRCMQGVMPVVTCHSVEDGEKVRRRIGSVVRLQTLDKCPGLLRDPPERTGRLLTPRGSVGDLHKTARRSSGQQREAVVMSRLLMVGLDHRPDEMLKDGPGVIEALANEDTKGVRERLSLSDVCGVPAALKIDLYLRSQRVRLSESAVFLIEGVQAFVRPVELGLEGCERMSRIEINHELLSP